MSPADLSSLTTLAEELLDHWERFLHAEHILHGLPQQAPDSPLFDTMARSEVLARDAIAWSIEQGVVTELVKAYQQAVEQREWTLPALIRLHLLVAQEILDHAHPLEDGTSARWELCVIPAIGRREDLYRFTGPDASAALNAMGLAPANGEAVMLGASTPDELFAFLSQPDKVMAWRQRCEQASDLRPVAEGLPLLTLNTEASSDTHIGAFVYVVGLVERYDSKALPQGSLIQNQEFETVEQRWAELAQQWASRWSTDLSIVEPDEIWDGCVYAVGGGLTQTFYLQHAIGGTPMKDGEGPAFAVVTDVEAETVRVIGLFPDGELISVSLDEDMVAFMPAILDSPDFEFDVIEEADAQAWTEELLGEDEPAPVKPRLLS